jgi:hypothetical protein
VEYRRVNAMFRSKVVYTRAMLSILDHVPISTA